MTKKVNASEAIAELQKGYRLFKAFEKGIETLEALQNAEQVESETKKRIEALRKEVADAESEKAKSFEEVQKAKDDAKEVAAKAKARADKIIEDAQAKADATAKDADAKLDAANQLMNDAKADAQKWRDEADKAKAEYEQTQKAIEALKKQAKALVG